MFRLGGRATARRMALEKQLLAVTERVDLLDHACGIGLWEAVLFQAEAAHPKSQWRWSPEFRRLIGYNTEAEFPNVMESWSGRLHPDDVAPTFAAFGAHLADKTGNTRYDVTYRLKVADGAYRWFRATGGCRYAADGITARACGSLTDIHAQKTLEAEMAAENERIAAVIGALTRGLDALAHGDLTVRVEGAFPEKYQALKTSFDASMAQLQETMLAIVLNARGVRGGAGEITQASDDLARRTEQQAANLEETAAALDEITATVRKTAEGATEARNVVTAAKADAERSGSVVSETVQAMNGIEESSKKIGNIIGVIDEIAFQTNLLALNAGVEAARAGDAGRGFAVVATEVRALAQRSADAAKEIKGLISASGQQVETGVRLVGETGKALTRIVEQVNRLNVLVGDIAGSAQEQATGLNEVNSAVNQMDQVTQQNAAMVEQTTAASHGLAGEAEALMALVGRFEIGGFAETPPVKFTPRKPVPKAVAKPVAPPMRKPAVAAKVGGEDWDEF